MSEQFELEPCPFCGGEAEIISCTKHWVRCTECFAESGAYPKLNDAAEAWNRRVGEEA